VVLSHVIFLYHVISHIIFEPSKNTAKISGAFIQILLRSRNCIYENKLKFATCYMIHKRIFYSWWLFTTLQSHDDNDDEWNFGRETNADAGIGFSFDTCTRSLCSNKLACVWSWTWDVCATMPPANITYAKNDNSKVRNLNDGPTLHKRFQDASLNFIWSYMLGHSP
jgi:hypothetical protein